MSLLALLLACTAHTDDTAKADTSADSADSDTDTDTDTDTDSDADTDSDTDTGTPPGDPVCGVRPAEDWWWDGACPQMPTPVHIVMDGCAMTLVYPSRMDMGMPYGGTVEGKAVSFIDGVNVDGCTGTIESPDSLSGSCSSGCTFVLAR